jgi:hypothetical protein
MQWFGKMKKQQEEKVASDHMSGGTDLRQCSSVTFYWRLRRFVIWTTWCRIVEWLQIQVNLINREMYEILSTKEGRSFKMKYNTMHCTCSDIIKSRTNMWKAEYLKPNFFNFYFFNFSGWAETESTWYCGHYLAYCTSPGWWVWSSRCNENWQGKPKYSEKTCPSATLSTT